ncbi:prephenate dehydrogenase [Streptomyces erythrochromogenes]|uniref:prephenate dehydrogenase n=1 Tax=Streptomyces erythrochromogenes TaxID=285574 RepID=UPI0036B67B80
MEDVLVVGTGLIGTSVALALTARGVRVYLRDSDPASARIASSLGAGSVEEPSTTVDLAVVAVPPALVPDVLVRLQAEGVARHYTDVASVKARPQHEATALACDNARYVGGHPMAGSERSGPLTARADLFDGCNWVLTPTSDTGTETLNAAFELVAMCGAVPVLMEAAAHDRAVGLVSHAPHLVASLVAALLEPAEERLVSLAGSGVRDLTRTATADPDLWVDILGANALVVADLLEELSEGLDDAVMGLRCMGSTDEDKRSDGARVVADLLRRGQAGRARISAKHGTVPEQYDTVTVLIGDQPGELARLFTDTARAGVNVEEVYLEHSAGRMTGLVQLSVVRNLRKVLVTTLQNHGWRHR